MGLMIFLGVGLSGGDNINKIVFLGYLEIKKRCKINIRNM